ncbi:MAG: flagellar basal body rod protein FlgB [Ignavibacteria bacterium]|nr:MAG: flagellar basal body rod protein FlgB [Ignavibacteria bacterium]KAF0160113.1 MAG: flagellar basal body rod protein FlgB [Ignavibacteria bacterium]
MASSVKLLSNLLDYCTEKNRVIAKNISNLATEGYQRQDVIFKDVLNESSSSLMKVSNSKHITSMQEQTEGTSKFEYVNDNSEDMVSGINNVNIEREMSELAENTLRFKFASKRVGDYYRSMQNVIRGGGR